jgi:hypothetical protein
VELQHLVHGAWEIRPNQPKRRASVNHPISRKVSWPAASRKKPEKKSPWPATPKKKKSKPDDDFCVVSVRFAEEPGFDEWVSVLGTREAVSQQFDLDNLPPGAVLRKGAEARRWLASAAKAEADYQRYRTRGNQ